MNLVYGSICSGIEAATQAWAPLGWKAAFFSEIEKFPSAVLAHHYGSNMPGEPFPEGGNGVPNYGDMRNFMEWPDHGPKSERPIDLLVGGTPCQSFSIAGLRKGLDDPRGNLMLTYLAIARRYRPKWLVWENVPGVLSSYTGAPDDEDIPNEGWEGEEDSDFAGLLRGVEELRYHGAWRILDTQYVRVDGFGRGIPQRRRRVFFVGYLGDWRRAAAVLFDRESLSGNPAPRRKTGQEIAVDVAPSLVSSGRGVERAGDTRGQDPVIAVFDRKAIAEYGSGDCGSTLSAKHSKYLVDLVATPVRATNHHADQVGYESHLVPEKKWPADVVDNVSHCLNAGGMGRIDWETETFVTTPIAFSSKDHGGDAMEGISPTLRSGNADTSHANGGVPPAVAMQQPYSIMPMNSGKDYKARKTHVAQPLMSGGPTGGNQGCDFVLNEWAVRRLTPLECDRLQGSGDNYTRIPWKNKPAEQCPDGPRYKAQGNGMSKNVLTWLGMRVELVEELFRSNELAGAGSDGWKEKST